MGFFEKIQKKQMYNSFKGFYTKGIFEATDLEKNVYPLILSKLRRFQ